MKGTIIGSATYAFIFIAFGFYYCFASLVVGAACGASLHEICTEIVKNGIKSKIMQECNSNARHISKQEKLKIVILCAINPIVGSFMYLSFLCVRILDDK